MDTDLREFIEWGESWVEGADKNDLPKVLIIGDSIVSAYAPFVQEKLKGKFYISKLATSRSFDQDFYWRQLDLFLSDPVVKYDLIMFNFGLHGFHLNIEEYGKGLEKLAERLLKENTKLCYMYTTPMVNFNNEEWVEKQLLEVPKRNETAKKIMSQKNIEIFDQYSLVLGNMDIRHPDPYHYNEKGKDLQAGFVAEKIIELLK